MSNSNAEAVSRIEALRASHDHFRDVAGSLTSAQLRSPGYPSEWSIAQTLSHLGSGAEINGLIFDAGVAGEAPPTQENFQAIWSVWDNKAPEEQGPDSIAADAVLVQKFESLTD